MNRAPSVVEPLVLASARRAKSRRSSSLDLSSLPPAPKTPPPTEPEPSCIVPACSALEGLEPVSFASGRAAPAARSRYALFVHQELLDAVASCAPSVRSALAYALRCLFAHGRTNRCKGVRGVNRGWLRAPLGGTNGQQYYLWFAEQGTRLGRGDLTGLVQTLKVEPSKAVRVLRALRHHDDTELALDPGEAKDYMSLRVDELYSADSVLPLPDPFTTVQREVRDERRLVRVLEGHPGAGKSTCLQLACEGLRGRALYLTHSAELANTARAGFDAFAPEGLQLEVRSFRELLRELAPEGSLRPALSLHDAAAALREALTPFGGSLGPWWREGGLLAEELFAELHAWLYGAALPVAWRRLPAATEPRLSPESYRLLREGVLGSDAIDAALLAATKLPEELRRELFGGPSAAWEAAVALAQGRASLDPERFAVEHFLIDEVQDLTLAEQWLLLEVIARSGALVGRRPSVVVAGDESQTVRPSAFEWGPFRELLHCRLGVAARAEERRSFELQENLRSPEALARFVNNARAHLYGKLDKRERPRGRSHAEPANTTVSRLLRVATADPASREALLRTLASSSGTAALVCPGALVPAELEEVARSQGVTLWSSEQAKGLEFRTVFVWDVPGALGRIEELVRRGQKEPLYKELARTSIDRFLVAVSRATESLVLLAPAWDEPACRVVAPMLVEDGGQALEGDLGVVTEAELEALCEMDAADARERIEALLLQSERMQVSDPRGALALARNARGLLGNAGRPGAASQELRARVRERQARASVACAVGRLAEEWPEALLEEARQAFQYAGAKPASAVCRTLSSLFARGASEERCVESLGELLEALRGTAEDPALKEAWRSLLERVAAHRARAVVVPSTPQRRRKTVALLQELEACEVTGAEVARWSEATREATLRYIVSDPDRAKEYAELRGSLPEGALRKELDAACAETLRDWASAAELWRALGRGQAALRCLRNAGELQQAATLAKELGAQEHPVLAWAASVRQLLSEAPAGELTEAERRVLERALEARLGRASAEHVVAARGRRSTAP